MQLRLGIEASLEGLEAARRAMREALLAAGAPEELVMRAELVLEELAMNVLMHGRRGDADPAMALEAGLDGDEAVLAFEDSGRAFDPTSPRPRPAATSLEDAPIGGLGLTLVRQAADALDHARSGEGRNRTTARFRPRG